ncbi:MAG TPA: hypothetical protein VNY84_03090, partial [Acidimicrobiales bacterium]|nr:hypothetical protein [Acidimicrobiales bacterium]
MLGARVLCGLGALGFGAMTVAVTSPAGAVDLARASRASLTVTSAHVVFNLTVTLPSRYVATLRGSGQIDFSHNSVVMSLNLLPGQLHSEQRTKQSASPLSSSVSTKPIQLTTEWIHGSAYVSLPASVASQIGGVPLAPYPVPAALGNDLNTSLSQTSVAITYAHLLVDTL